MMTSNGNAPIGADYEPNCPWRQPDLKEKEIEVTVSITLSKSFKITIPDIPIEDIDLKDEVKSNIYLPGDINIIQSLPNVQIHKSVIEDLSNWTVDDFEVIPE